jgi:hypothetical protein
LCTPDRNFGRLRGITNPAIGNHEYESGTPQAYSSYWNNIPRYYSFNTAGYSCIGGYSCGGLRPRGGRKMLTRSWMSRFGAAVAVWSVLATLVGGTSAPAARRMTLLLLHLQLRDTSMTGQSRFCEWSWN